MRILILRAKNGALCMPEIDKYEKSEIDHSFYNARHARTRAKIYDTATIYLSNRHAVLKLTKIENQIIHYDIRSFNFSFDSQKSARAIYTFLNETPYIKEQIRFSRNAKIL